MHAVGPAELLCTSPVAADAVSQGATATAQWATPSEVQAHQMVLQQKVLAQMHLPARTAAAPPSAFPGQPYPVNWPQSPSSPQFTQAGQLVPPVIPSVDVAQAAQAAHAAQWAQYQQESRQLYQPQQQQVLTHDVRVIESKLAAEQVRVRQQAWAEDMQRKYIETKGKPSSSPSDGPHLESPGGGQKLSAFERLVNALGNSPGSSPKSPGPDSPASPPRKLRARAANAQEDHGSDAAKTPKASEHVDTPPKVEGRLRARKRGGRGGAADRKENLPPGLENECAFDSNQDPSGAAGGSKARGRWTPKATIVSGQRILFQ